MINKNEIDEVAATLQVNASDVQRDYVHGWILQTLFNQSPLGDELTLKGGNALRKGYFTSSRYSADLDFTTQNAVNQQQLGRELNRICAAIQERSGVVFDSEKTRVEDKRRVDNDKSVVDARVYFQDFYGKTNSLLLRVRVDITQFDRIYLPVQNRNLIHPYSDHEQCSGIIRCVKLEEILAAKMRCLLQRKHIADLYDLVYATIVEPDLNIDRGELISTFFRITVFERQPEVVKGLFLDLPLEAAGRFWTKYISCPATSLFDFETAQTKFLELLDLLIPGQADSEYSRIFFPARLRTPIMIAGDTSTLLKVSYKGVERLIEPYSLQFKQRRDGVAREYLYLYDTTGGARSDPGDKTFISENMGHAENTEEIFEPRYDIELSKAGGIEVASRFEGKRGTRGGITRRSNSSRTSVRQPRRRAALRSSAPYRVQCPYCNKQFPRHRPDTKLNRHKDFYGNVCHGRSGFMV